MKKKNALVLADNRPFLIGHVLLQINDTNKNLFDEALIYYDEITENDKKILNSILPCRFIKYNAPFSEKVKNLEHFKRFSELMFPRFEMFKLLDEYETVMWIDTDVLIQDKLDDLILMARESGMVANFEDEHNCSSKNPDYVLTSFTHPIDGYDMKRYNMSSGLIVVNETLPLRSEYTNWLYEKTEELSEKLVLPDQGILNIFVQEFKINVSCAGKTYCTYPYYGRNTDSEKIVHSWGSRKFWNNWYLYNKYPKWKYYYDKWIEMGGSKYDKEIKPLVSVVIPTFRPNIDYFKASLESILIYQTTIHGQEFDNIEVIIVAEPDGVEAVEELVKQFDDFRLILHINKKRIGIAASLNVGIRISNGDYIARMDDDDISGNLRLYKQTEFLDKNKDISLCTTDFEYFGDMNEARVSFSGEMSKAWSIFTCPFDHPTIMFRKDFFIENNLFYDEDRRFVEDWELWLRAFDKGMKVGSIDEVLFYHRWINNSSSGQTTQTVDMMRELVKKNFSKLNVEIGDEYISYIGPWNGKILDEEIYAAIENIFSRAIEYNFEKNIYDSFSLLKVFNLRLQEAKTGKLEGLVYEARKNNNYFYNDIKDKNNVINEINSQSNNNLPPPFFKRVKRFLGFWRSFPHTTFYKLDTLINNFNIINNDINLKYNNIIESITVEKEKIKHLENIVVDLDNKIDSNNVIKILSNRLYEIETKLDNYNNKLNANNYQENENTRQTIANRLYEIETKLDNYDIKLNANNYQENENTRQTIINRLYKIETKIASDRNELYSINRHIDFTYRDLMILLDKINNFIKKKNIELKTDFPIAFESNDHKFPHGTIRDNTRYPRFITKCESLFKNIKELSFLDLGCSGGGMVLEAALKGHFSIGLEGSDISYRQQRAEWRLLGDNLKTCDITKPFELLLNDEIYKFDIITAWEVLEHIKEEDLGQLFKNIYNHLSDNGRFIASIANWDDIDPVTGVNWHVTKHDYEWWRYKFEANGFIVCTDEFDTIDLARGGYNPPHCYEEPYREIDLTKNFHIVVKIN